eukprot:scaffold292718_cov26-Prasinocladus_malaysianus.AAC.2
MPADIKAQKGCRPQSTQNPFPGLDCIPVVLSLLTQPCKNRGINTRGFDHHASAWGDGVV